MALFSKHLLASTISYGLLLGVRCGLGIFTSLVSVCSYHVSRLCLPDEVAMAMAHGMASAKALVRIPSSICPQC